MKNWEFYFKLVYSFIFVVIAAGTLYGIVLLMLMTWTLVLHHFNLLYPLTFKNSGFISFVIFSSSIGVAAAAAFSFLIIFSRMINEVEREIKTRIRGWKKQRSKR